MWFGVEPGKQLLRSMPGVSGLFLDGIYGLGAFKTDGPDTSLNKLIVYFRCDRVSFLNDGQTSSLSVNFVSCNLLTIILRKHAIFSVYYVDGLFKP